MCVNVCVCVKLCLLWSTRSLSKGGRKKTLHFYFYYHCPVCGVVWEGAGHSACVEVRRQLYGVSSLLLPSRGFWGLALRCHACVTGALTPLSYLVILLKKKTFLIEIVTFVEHPFWTYFLIHRIRIRKCGPGSPHCVCHPRLGLTGRGKSQ